MQDQQGVQVSPLPGLRGRGRTGGSPARRVDRDTDDRLFRDIRGDEYYPVYGDNSERGFDAQSSGNLFIKVEKGQSYVLYGDIAIEPEAPEFRLGGYSRLTTGAKAGWKNDAVSVSVFAANTAQKQRVVEFAGRGVSGPYTLDLSTYREGSDRVEIIVRDEITGEILSERSMRRLTDYVLNYFTNTIVFVDPVRQADRYGNPISVRVTYETEAEKGDKHWIYGGEVNYKASENLTVGLRAINVDASGLTAERERVRAAYARAQLTNDMTLEVEVAQAENGLSQSGSAARAMLRRQTRNSTLEIEASHTEEGFDPTGSSIGPGQDRLRIDYALNLSGDRNVIFSGAHVRDQINGSERSLAEVLYERPLTEEIRTRQGYRYERIKTQLDARTELYAVMGIIWEPAKMPSLRPPPGGASREQGTIHQTFSPVWQSVTSSRVLATRSSRIGKPYRYPTFQLSTAVG